MPSIISSGIGSGLDIAGIVQQLVAAEGQPVATRLGLQEARAQSKLSAFGSIKSALADLRDKLDVMKDLNKFLARKAVSGNEDYFTVTADSDAVPSSFGIEVVQLAQAQKLTSGAFADSDTIVGTGTLTIQMGADAVALEINAENNTLAGIRDTINASLDNPGVAATIVNAESGSYLILTSASTGAANTIKVTQSGGDGGLATLEYDPPTSTALTESIAAQDGLIRIDGFDVFSENNTFAGAVQGVTITALQDTGGGSESLAITNDEDAVRDLVANFVTSYNALVETFDNLTDYDADADAAAPLLGDATVRGIRDQIRRELSVAVSDISGPFSALNDIGIDVQLDGKLAINDEDLSAALADDFVQLGQLFANSDGFAVRLHGLADSFLESDGIIEARTKGLTDRIESIGEDGQALNQRLAALETRLLRQFNALDSLLATLSSTSNFLSQQLNNLPGFVTPGSNG
ncbi:MAG: flagellar filament capping protein FliD [Gammaproteobacteria bacterium]|nr:flagellar filament capping protein FliD [Gammaproteobacteria bacterium]MDH3429812.1 flagellar filament capping protein FliD [Gammaproteobacteria bacterium]MDH3433172.1 flagellar filament capping protein FliD [Gammaproteobacteria bacterium]